jgi:hypothetical protein
MAKELSVVHLYLFHIMLYRYEVLVKLPVKPFGILVCIHIISYALKCVR